MSQGASVNCVGFVYHRLGFVKGKEVYIEPPDFEDLPENLVRVDSIELATAVVVLDKYRSDIALGSVSHLALIDKGVVTHRDGCDAEITTEPFNEAFKMYLRYPRIYDIIFLAQRD